MKQLKRINFIQLTSRKAFWLILFVSGSLLVACKTSKSGSEMSTVVSDHNQTETAEIATSLTSLSADPMTSLSASSSYLDPVYHTVVKKATSAADGQKRMRHEYSRRQAFNADQTRFLAQDESGHWFLYDGQNYHVIRMIPELVGDCEPIWHAKDARLLYFTERGGGQKWWLLNVETGQTELVFDFAEQSSWQEAQSYWTKGEGTTSADGHYLTLIASTYDAATQQTKVYGIVVLDLIERRIVGELPANDFPKAGAMPDHVSTAASGQYAVVSWLAEDGGTIAYSLDFTKKIPLAPSSEHSDLALTSDGRDVLVYADYAQGSIVSIDLATGESTPLHSLYPAEGEGYALHISGQAVDMPGWVVVSTYADFADYGKTMPAPILRPEYRKIWLLELKPDGRAFNVAHIRSNWDEVTEDEYYFLEPQASVSRDLTKIIFATNLDGAIESYVVELALDVFH